MLHRLTVADLLAPGAQESEEKQASAGTGVS